MFNDFIFICDESGRMGYAAPLNQSVNDEICVVAGMLIPVSKLSEFNVFSEDLHLQFSEKCSGKFHIAEFQSQVRFDLRQKIFDYLKVQNIKIAYAALYFEPFSRVHYVEKEARSKDNESKIYINVVRKFNFQIQSKCFYFCKTKVMCSLTGDKKITFWTDPMDESILLEYRRFTVDDEPLRYVIYDSSTKQKTEGQIGIHFTDMHTPKSEVLSVDTVSSTLSICADVVSNSLAHHLKNYSKESGYGPLNSQDAIIGHELFELFLCPHSVQIDRIYAHPLARK